MPPVPPQPEEDNGVEQTLELMLQQQTQASNEINQNLELQLEGQGKMLDKLARMHVKVNGTDTVVIEGPQGETGPQGPAPKRGVDYFTKKDVEGMIQEVRKLIPDPAPGKTPVKGEDYFTDTDIADIINEILPILPPGPQGVPGADGETPVVDYDLIIKEAAKRIVVPKAKPGKDGSPDTPTQIVEKLTSLPQGERLSYDALDNTPNLELLSRQASRDYDLAELKDVDVTDANTNAILQYQPTTRIWDVGVAITVSATAPTDPKENDLWIDIS